VPLVYPCVGSGQGGWRKRACFLRLWEDRAAPVTVMHQGHPGLAFMKAVAVTSQHSLESTTSPMQRAGQLLGGDPELKASFGASLCAASPSAKTLCPESQIFGQAAGNVGWLYFSCYHHSMQSASGRQTSCHMPFFTPSDYEGRHIASFMPVSSFTR